MKTRILVIMMCIGFIGFSQSGLVAQTAGLTPQSLSAEFQTHLTFLGFNPGGIDGQIGGGTRSAIRQFQLQNRLQVTGRPDSRTQQAMYSRVDEKLRETYGTAFTGEYGTSAGCRISTARFRIKGLHVLHLPTWTDQTFDYTLLPSDGNRFRIAWEANNRLEGQSLQFDPRRQTFRTPELNMIALSKCPEQSGEGNNDGFSTPSVPTVPSTALGDVSAELENLRNTIAQAEQIRQSIHNKLDQRNGAFGSMSAQVASLEANLTSTQAQADELRRKLRRQRRISDDLQAEIDQTNTNISSMTRERDDLLAENADLLRALNEGGRGGGGKARLRAENAALKLEVDRLNNLLQQQAAQQQPQQQQKQKGLIFQSNDGRFQFSLGGR